MFEATGLTIDEVRNQVDPNSFFKGKDYFTQGRVQNIECFKWAFGKNLKNWA